MVEPSYNGWSSSELEQIVIAAREFGLKDVARIADTVPAKSMDQVDALVQQTRDLLCDPSIELPAFIQHVQNTAAARLTHQSFAEEDTIKSQGALGDEISSNRNLALEMKAMESSQKFGNPGIPVTTGHSEKTTAIKRKRGRPAKSSSIGSKSKARKVRGSKGTARATHDEKNGARGSARKVIQSPRFLEEHNMLKRVRDEATFEQLQKGQCEPGQDDIKFIQAENLVVESRSFAGRYPKTLLSVSNPSKKSTLLSSELGGASKRKSLGIVSRGPQRSGLISQQTRDVLSTSMTGRNALKLVHAIENHSFRKWCTYHFFYSPMDKGFYQENIFQDKLLALREQGISVQGDTKFSRSGWSMIRLAMLKGKRTRRFSTRFINEQKQMLQSHRTKFAAGGQDPALSVGDSVTAVHPTTFQLANGVILSKLNGNYLVQFLDHELGTKDVDGCYICPSSKMQPVKENPNMAAHSHRSGFPVGMLDYHNAVPSRGMQLEAIELQDTKLVLHHDPAVVCQLMQLVDQKSALLEELDLMNQTAQRIIEELGAELSFPRRFVQLYAWLLQRLQSVNADLNANLDLLRNESKDRTVNGSLQFELKPAQIRFVSRWVKNGNALARAVTEAVGKEFEKNEPIQAASLDRLQRALQSVNQDNERSLSTGCMALLLALRHCAENKLAPELIDDTLNALLEQLSPKFARNVSAFREIKAHVALLKTYCLERQNSVFLS